MTTDRELLELAAKAAGIELQPFAIKPATGDGDGFVGYMVDAGVWPRGWFNPLTDDGDALRLAVKLQLEIGFGVDTRVYSFRRLTAVGAGENTGSDWYAATRRAIVRAAAELGKEKQNG
jgi:hypothetical protein